MKLTELARGFKALLAVPVALGAIAALSSNPGLLMPAFAANALLAAALLTSGRPSVEVELRVEPERVKVGEELTLRARVRVKGGFGVVLLRLPPHPGTRAAEAFELVDGTNVRVLFKGFRPALRAYEVRLRALKRGEHSLEGVQVAYFHLLGASRPAAWSAPARVRVLVLPRVGFARARVPLRQRQLAPRAPPSRAGPPSTDFASVREYEPGDPFKFINWKATARLGKVMVNEFEREGSRSILLVVDRSPAMLAGTTVENSLEYAVSLAATLARVLLRGGASVGLYALPPEPDIPPSTGEAQFVEILKGLVLMRGRAVERGRGPDPRLSSLVAATRPVLVVITNVASRREAARLASLLGGLPARGVLVDVIPDNLPLKRVLGRGAALPWAAARAGLYRALPKRFRVVTWDPAVEGVGAAVVRVLNALRWLP